MIVIKLRDKLKISFEKELNSFLEFFLSIKFQDENSLDYFPSAEDSPQKRIYLVSSDLDNSQELHLQRRFRRISIANRNYILADFAFDVSDNIFKDISIALGNSGENHIVTISYSRIWFPLIRFLEIIGLKKKRKKGNYLPFHELSKLMLNFGLVPTRKASGMFIPFSITKLNLRLNESIALIPFAKKLSPITLALFRPIRYKESTYHPKVSVVVPVRNELGHLPELISRLPTFPGGQQVIFVEGGSHDGSFEYLESVVQSHPDSEYLLLKQTKAGKANAVHEGLKKAVGEVAIILDADLSVPPEELNLFYEILTSGTADFCNGSRFFYDREVGSMRFLNTIANRIFSNILSALTGQHLSDTLCGTKAFWIYDYRDQLKKIEKMGIKDPFGDFDFLVGARLLNLKVVNIPVHYKARTYGTTNISRFRDGLKLARYCIRLRKALPYG